MASDLIKAGLLFSLDTDDAVSRRLTTGMLIQFVTQISDVVEKFLIFSVFLLFYNKYKGILSLKYGSCVVVCLFLPFQDMNKI